MSAMLWPCVFYNNKICTRQETCEVLPAMKEWYSLGNSTVKFTFYWFVEGLFFMFSVWKVTRKVLVTFLVTLLSPECSALDLTGNFCTAYISIPVQYWVQYCQFSLSMVLAFPQCSPSGSWSDCRPLFGPCSVVFVCAGGGSSLSSAGVAWLWQVSKR